jgi:hypothetical protein
VGLLGLEPALLEEVAADCGGAPWWPCDVCDRAAMDAAVGEALRRLGGLDVAIANAGVGAQMPLVGGEGASLRKDLSLAAPSVRNSSGSCPLVPHPCRLCWRTGPVTQYRSRLVGARRHAATALLSRGRVVGLVVGVRP